jgi:hypothetical protein
VDDLELSSDGLHVLDDWLTRCKSPEDAKCVTELLEDISKRRWQGRWNSYTQVEEPGITTMMPRDGLHVHVRLWMDEVNQFTITSISEVPPEEESG